MYVLLRTASGYKPVMFYINGKYQHHIPTSLKAIPPFDFSRYLGFASTRYSVQPSLLNKDPLLGKLAPSVISVQDVPTSPKDWSLFYPTAMMILGNGYRDPLGIKQDVPEEIHEQAKIVQLSFTCNDDDESVESVIKNWLTSCNKPYYNTTIVLYMPSSDEGSPNAAES